MPYRAAVALGVQLREAWLSDPIEDLLSETMNPVSQLDSLQTATSKEPLIDLSEPQDESEDELADDSFVLTTHFRRHNRTGGDETTTTTVATHRQTRHSGHVASIEHINWSRVVERDAASSAKSPQSPRERIRVSVAIDVKRDPERDVVMSYG